MSSVVNLVTAGIIWLVHNPERLHAEGTGTQLPGDHARSNFRDVPPEGDLPELGHR
jgi:hypothetical protein